MSYILEALKKSDLQRKKEHVPDLNTVQLELPSSEKKRALWPYLLAGVLLLNVLFFLYFIMRQDQRATESLAVVRNSDSQQSVIVQEKHTGLEEPKSMQGLSSVTQESPSVDLVAAVDKNKVASKKESDSASSPDSLAVARVVPQNDTEKVDKQTVSEMNSVMELEQGDVESVLEPVAEDIHKEAAKETVPESKNIIVPEKDFAIAPEPELVEKASLPEELIPKPAINKVQQPLSDSPTVSSQITAVPQSTPHLRQLPASIRQELPEIHIGAHVYFKNKPSSRLASINGKLMREGNTLAPDLKVAEISPDGVIFSYQKYFFHVPVF